jgi:quercetin dioxygenase-like cupin family protein
MTPAKSNDIEFDNRDDRLFNAAVLDFNLTEQIAALKLEKQWLTAQRSAITLVKTPDLTIILMIFQAGITFPEHSAEGQVSVLVLSGSVDFIVENKTRHLKAPSLINLAGDILHTVNAIKESVLLLTVVRRSE